MIGPVFLALVIVLLVHPLHTWLRHKKVPEGLALVVLLLAIFGVLVVLGSILVLAVGRLITVLPQYAAEADGLVSSLRDFLVAQGISRETASSLLANVSLGAVIQAITPLLSGVVGLVVNALSALGVLIAGISQGFGGFLAGLVAAIIILVVGSLLIRVYCELVILAFKIYDELKAIRTGTPPGDAGFPVTPMSPMPTTRKKL